ncbi:major facilitator superfamily domain-containing protein [Corynascus similis CBS 632.67]
MSTEKLPTPPGLQPDEERNLPGYVSERSNEDSMSESDKALDLLALHGQDPALNRKMCLVNNAIDELGWTPYHTKLFFLNGFGYAVDSLVMLLQSVIAGQAYMEFGEHGYETGMTIALYSGMFVGSLFWGLGADIIGRKHAFNFSLIICCIATIVAGGMPNWPSLGFFISLLGFGAGGNLVLDTTVFLEYLPGNKQWAVTLMAMWWGVGQAITGFIAWGFLVDDKWNCSSKETCTKSNNMGWRYVMFTSGALVLVMSVLRLTLVQLKETPKYLLGMRDDKQVVDTFEYLAKKYNRPCSLTLEKLEACGELTMDNKKSFSLSETFGHLRGLFITRKTTLSTLMLWLSWIMMGLVYPLFYAFLPSYLASLGADLSVTEFEKWRNYALTNISGIFSPILAAWMCNIPLLGRRYTMLIGALLTATFFFAYTAVRTQDQNVGFSCTIAFCLNIYYGVLFAYTPEVLPSAHRATGNGIAIAGNRVMGALSAVIATEADTATSAPIFICGGLFAALGIVAALFPFEPYGRRSS